MKRNLLFMLLALGCLLLLGGGAYRAFQPNRDPKHPAPPFPPSVQAIPDLGPRVTQMREALQRSDEVALLGLVLQIARFSDAALQPIEHAFNVELRALPKDDATHDLARPLSVPERLLVALLDATDRIATPEAQSTWARLAASCASRHAPPRILLRAAGVVPAARRELASQALAEAAKRAVDEPCKAAYASAPAEQLPEAMKRLTEKGASPATAAEALIFAGAPPPSGLPPEAVAVLREGQKAAPAGAAATPIDTRLAAVHWTEAEAARGGEGTLPLLERSAAEPPTSEEWRSLSRAAMGSLARLASGGTAGAVDALDRLFRAGDAERRNALAEQLTLYATARTADLLRGWAGEPAIVPEAAARARKVLDALRAEQVHGGEK